MKLEQCTKWELKKLVRSLSDQEEVKRRLDELERDRERVKLYIQRTRNYKPIATIYDARDFKGEREMSGYIQVIHAAKQIRDKYDIPLHELADTFADIPVADVKEVVHGYWKYNVIKELVCSVCRGLALASFYSGLQYRSAYCPNCGAKMDGEQTT